MSLRTDLIAELRTASRELADDTARRQRVARAATSLRFIDPAFGYRELAKLAGFGTTALFRTTKLFGATEPVTGELPSVGAAAALILALPAGTRMLVASMDEAIFEALRRRAEGLDTALVIHSGVVSERLDAPLHLCSTCELAGLVLERLMRTSDPLVILLDHAALPDHLREAAAEREFPIVCIGGAPW